MPVCRARPVLLRVCGAAFPSGERAVIDVTCPECAHGYEVDDSLAGQGVNCPECGERQRVKALPAVVAVPPGTRYKVAILMAIAGATALIAALAIRFAAYNYQP